MKLKYHQYIGIFFLFCIKMNKIGRNTCQGLIQYEDAFSSGSFVSLSSVYFKKLHLLEYE